MWLSKVPGHIDHRIMPDLFTPLADGALVGATLGDSVLIAAATVALATQGLSPVLLHFAVAGT